MSRNITQTLLERFQNHNTEFIDSNHDSQNFKLSLNSVSTDRPQRTDNEAFQQVFSYSKEVKMAKKKMFRIRLMILQ